MLFRISTALAIILASGCLFAGLSFAKTGVLEIYTNPPGVEVFINSIYVGDTPFNDPDIKTGDYRIDLVLEKTGERHSFSVVIDTLTPQVHRIDFQQPRPKTFNGKIEEPEFIRARGNIQFASIPTGATVAINGEEIATTPVSFRDADTGLYKVRFTLNDKVLTGDFRINNNETGKLIADFDRGVIIDKWREEKSKLARKEKAREEHLLEEKEQAREEHLLKDLAQLSPDARQRILRARDQQYEIVPIEEMYESNRSYYYSAMDLNPTVVNYYKLPYDKMTLELKNLKKAKSARLGEYFEGEYVFRYGKHTRRGRLNSSNLSLCRFTLYNDLTIKVSYDPDDYGGGRGKGKVFVSVR